MKLYSFQFVIEKEPEDEGYFAYTPNVPGCFSNGKTIEETKRNIREAIEQHLVSMLAHPQPVPQNDRLAGRGGPGMSRMPQVTARVG
jgi:predicted RNase H-like HicB family nuclease